jgi:predicted ABC-type ATPase/predicted transcriptional regulator with HTH domain
MTTNLLYLFHLTKAKLRKRLLVHFFAHPEANLYLREIAHLIQVDPANLSRELRFLEKEGIFQSHKRGLQKFFSLNRNFPLYHEIKKIVEQQSAGAKETPKANVTEKNKGGKHPKLYIVAGPNGAGKTTFAKRFLPDYAACRQFVNADLIAGGLAPFSPETAALHAGRLLLEEIQKLSAKKVDFGFETTLSGVTYTRLLEKLRHAGYQIHLFFLWIPSLELALARIEDRVRRGGHHIPEPVVRRRFYKSIRHLFNRYRILVDSWTLFDNSWKVPHLIAAEADHELCITDQSLFDKISKEAEIK